MSTPQQPDTYKASRVGLYLLLIAVAIVGGAAWFFMSRTNSSGLTLLKSAPGGAAADTFASTKLDQSSTAGPSATPASAGRARSKAVVPKARSDVPETLTAPPMPGPVDPSKPTPGAHTEPGPANLSNATTDVAEALPIYDASNADVVPPGLLLPVANAPVRTDSRAAPGAAAIEIIVNHDGSVGSVKGATQPRTIGESLEMVNGLSITKSWRFTPALRNGQPVRYRLFVPLSTLLAGRRIR
ncbi:MAG: hypothetical protein ABIP90_11465 [Vicinamibacterales bacterium]